MVKGISRQVILVQSPDPKLFEQAIFILKDGQGTVTDDVLMKEAKRLIASGETGRKAMRGICGPLWAAAGATATGLAWLLASLI